MATIFSQNRPEPDSYLPSDPEERPGAWLALLRADIGLRWDAGEPTPVEKYRERYPDLDEEVLVGLVYEEFCLKEEAGDAPSPADYESRFPDLATRLRRVLDIHALVGGPDAPTLGSMAATISTTGLQRTRRDDDARQSNRIEFPEAGETIGGFRLIEELGRGSFARVYLAHERLLADRPVALKVATAGSREPQTLARLQHTHIVPVHSYRVDQITGLHLLCMPFFGRTTLAGVLAEPETATLRSGTELLSVLDRLEPSKSGLPRSLTAARKALASRSFSGAISWWGARLAEALQHAHDRGVLHRDVKPSNVLVTADGLPMLLDFNLALGPRIDDSETESEDESDKLGGTLAYMAPEHIEALADGIDTGVDARADIFAMGVVLFEALAGERPFPVVRKARSVAEALLQTAEQRRAGPPLLRRCGRPLSPALEAVVRRCLEPEPDRRYASATELATDLQAVADDGPLRVAREPLVSRLLRWLRRNRWKFAVAAPAVVAGSVLVATLHDVRVRRVSAEGEIRRSIDQADLNQQNGKLETAIQGYDFAMSAASRYPTLSDMWREAKDKQLWAKHTLALEMFASDFFEKAEWLRYRLFGFVEPERPPGEALDALLDPLLDFDPLDWAANPDLDRLPPDRRRRLLDEVPQLLFLRAIHLWLSGADGPELASGVAQLRDRAVRAMPADDPRRPPWDALCEEVGVRRPGVAPASGLIEQPGDRARHEAEAAFLWGIEYAARFQGTGDPTDAALALSRLESAARGRPDAYWPRFYLAAFALESGDETEALRHADTAVALKPRSSWALFNRALAAWASGDSASALRDLRAAKMLIPNGDRDRLKDRIELNLGLVLLERGDPEGARRFFESVLGPTPAGSGLARMGARLSFASTAMLGGASASSTAELTGLSAVSLLGGSGFDRAARLDLARLDAEDGRPDLALLAYSDLLIDDPGLREARFGRALLMLALGNPEAAEADADLLLNKARRDIQNAGGRFRPPSNASMAEVLEFRALCRLATDRPEAALADASEAVSLAPSPARERLQLRSLLATRPKGSFRLDDPTLLDLLPEPGLSLSDDLRATAEALAVPPDDAETSPLPRMLTRAVLLSALGATEEADQVASDAAFLAPDAALPRLVRARIRYRQGDLAGALADLDTALALRPGDVESLTLRGQVLVESGEPVEGLADLERARVLGRDDETVLFARGLALAAVGNPSAAIDSVTEAMAHDPQNPLLTLFRARLHLDNGRPTAAQADLDHAWSWSGDRPELRALVALQRAMIPVAPASIKLRSVAETVPEAVEGQKSE